MRCKHGLYYYNCSVCSPIRTVVKPREDLMMLTEGKYLDLLPKSNAEETRGVRFASVYGGRLGSAYLSIGRGWEPPAQGHKIFLVSRKKYLMDSNYGERRMIIGSTALCPENANVFVGGLGLGLILLYLAKTGKPRHVTVAELDKLVIKLVEPRVRKWLSNHYPSFSFEVVEGDAVETVKQSRYDWAFLDMWSSSFIGRREDGSYGHMDEPFLLRAKAAANETCARVTCWNEKDIVSRSGRKAAKPRVLMVDQLAQGLPKLHASLGL